MSKKDFGFSYSELKEGQVASVADFGMARMKEEKEDTSKTKQNFGPLKWMAPGTKLSSKFSHYQESIKNQQYSKKTDAFSYGVVLWEIGLHINQI